MQNELLLCRAFCEDMLLNSFETLPFSFEYGGTRIKGIPSDWAPELKTETFNSRVFRTQVTGLSPNSRMRVTFELTTYKDSPVCEWVVWFKNVGLQDSKVLADIQAADFALPEMIYSNPILWHAIAENHEGKNYSEYETTMEQGKRYEFQPDGGRPCDNAFPYFRVHAKEGGAVVAVGWPGAWSASFTKWDSSVFVKAGQAETEMSLHPGETIRTPRITMMFYVGDTDYSINLWRKWYRHYIISRDQDGMPLQPKWCGYARDAKACEFCDENEYSQIDAIRAAKDLGFKIDTWWIDAGWYDCTMPKEDGSQERIWWYTGNWHADANRFPRGLKPISDELKKGNPKAELLTWFEPERILRKDSMFEEHPEFIITLKNDKEHDRMLNLGNPDCVKYLAKFMSTFIHSNGIDVYRQDFNFDPLPFWKQNDEEDGEFRTGFTENQYVQGYLKYWDYLLVSCPGLWIDSCASGGRRNDLETMRRAVPLHYSDYGYTEYVEKQRYHDILSQWFMFYKDAPHFCADIEGNKGTDLYAALCSIAPMYLHSVRFPKDFDLTNDKKVYEIWNAMKPYFISGKYHMLSKREFGEDKWDAIQFNRGDSGVVRFIRNEKNADDKFTVKLYEICDCSKYQFTDLVTGETKEISGKDLNEAGFTCALAPRSATVYSYKKI